MEKNKVYKISALLILAVVVTAASCKKAGTGGHAGISAFPEHHGQPIDNGMVYIKYNTSELPGTNPSDFDNSTAIVSHDGAGHAHFHDLKKGKYYIYHIGYDSAIKETVKGGIPVEIKKEADMDVKIPVTED